MSCSPSPCHSHPQISPIPSPCPPMSSTPSPYCCMSLSPSPCHPHPPPVTLKLLISPTPSPCQPHPPHEMGQIIGFSPCRIWHTSNPFMACFQPPMTCLQPPGDMLPTPQILNPLDCFWRRKIGGKGEKPGREVDFSMVYLIVNYPFNPLVIYTWLYLAKSG